VTDRYICIHGHFYQPPRENPCLEAIEIQDSAYPYHDWNERVTAECYAPNSASRILDGSGRIVDIVNTYARISFNFGPTLLSWMQSNAAEVYHAILKADRLSMTWRSGHGNAVAQVFNHIIMPLANYRDKRTQVLWGIRDFVHRFGRFPEGMWLAETAVDMETLDILAEAGILFTVLAPHQAHRVRRIGSGKWQDLSGGEIDPSRAYLCKLPHGRKINLFFYDGPISNAVAFEKLLNRGEDFAERLLGGFSEERDWPQLLHIATDGETYGHHHKFGDMALAYALSYIEGNGLARITNYGEYLEKHPPVHEVQIFENTSWSCYHGIERWRSDCGCNSGGNSGWNQQWRTPLRAALDGLRDRLVSIYEQEAAQYLTDPWRARDEYVDVVLDRSRQVMDDFLRRHAVRELSGNDLVRVLSLLEIQRHAMLMYTSCGWFFDELSGIETVQVIEYAARAVQLAERLFPDNLEEYFVKELSAAKSNLPELGDGRRIYEKFVRPSMIDLLKVGAHYAVSAVFEDYVEKTEIFSYRVDKEDLETYRSGQSILAVGKITVNSYIIPESGRADFCVLYFGNHALNGAVRPFRSDEDYGTMRVDAVKAFTEGDFAEIVHIMDRDFGTHNYSIRDLFRDEQRKILKLIISKTLADFEHQYSVMYENSRSIMGFLRDIGMPVPKRFLAAAEMALNLDLQTAVSMDTVDVARARKIFEEIQAWNVPVGSINLEFLLRRKIEQMMLHFRANPDDMNRLVSLRELMEFVAEIPIELNYWKAQNIYFEMARTEYRRFSAGSGGETVEMRMEEFRKLGELMSFDTTTILPEK
jgi:alpha-amylase/alpha-mannosidase (GH57 family)